MTDALASLGNVIAFSSRDWSQDRGDAWIYGIVCGWDGDEGDEGGTMAYLARRHGWASAEVVRLRALHAHWLSLRSDGWHIADEAAAVWHVTQTMQERAIEQEYADRLTRVLWASRRRWQDDGPALRPGMRPTTTAPSGLSPHDFAAVPDGA